MSINSQDIEQIPLLMSIKDSNSVSNLRKMTIYNPNLDFVNGNVYIKLCIILSILFQVIEQKPYADVNQGP